MLTVAFDPRLDLSDADITAKNDALDRIDASKGLGFQAVERLKEAIKLANDYSKKLKEKDEEGFEEQIKLCKTTADTLNTFLDAFLGKVDKRQGITRGQPQSVNNSLRGAQMYTGSATHAPGATELKLIDKFEADLQAALKPVNDYFESEWPKFRETVEPIDLSPFKDYEKIE